MHRHIENSAIVSDGLAHLHIDPVTGQVVAPLVSTTGQGSGVPLAWDPDWPTIEDAVATVIRERAILARAQTPLEVPSTPGEIAEIIEAIRICDELQHFPLQGKEGAESK